MSAEKSASPVPLEITLRKASRTLAVRFGDGIAAELTAEYLRVHSPSAEVTGHSTGEGLLVAGKESVGIVGVEPVGRYAVRIVFDDGHDSGLYTWPILYELCKDREQKWSRYLARLAEQGIARGSEVEGD